MAFTSVTITGTFQDAQGNAAVGDVYFDLTAPIRDTASNITRVPERIVVTLDADGAIPADTTLTATDDPTTDPQGVGYYVTYVFDGTPRYSYLMYASYTAGTLDLADVEPAGAEPVTYYRPLTIQAARYGVVADGTDQSAAFARVFDVAEAAGGAIIELGAGTYRTKFYDAGVGGTITLPDNCQLVGQGSGVTIIKGLASTIAALGQGVHGLRMMLAGSNTKVRGITFDGDKDAITALALKDCSSILLRLVQGSDNFDMEDVIFQNAHANMSLHTIGSASVVGTAVTVTLGAAHNWKVGDGVTISGHGGTGIDGTWTTTAVTSTTFTFTSSSGTPVAGTGGNVIDDVSGGYEGFAFDTNTSTHITGRRIIAQDNLGTGIHIAGSDFSDAAAGFTTDVHLEQVTTRRNGWMGVAIFIAKRVSISGLRSYSNSNGVSAYALNTEPRGRGLEIEWSDDVRISNAHIYDNHYCSLGMIGKNESIYLENYKSENGGATITGDGTNFSPGCEISIKGGTQDSVQSVTQNLYLTNAELLPATGRAVFATGQKTGHNSGNSIPRIVVNNCPGWETWRAFYGTNTSSIGEGHYAMEIINHGGRSTDLPALTLTGANNWSTSGTLTVATTGPFTGQRSSQAYKITWTTAVSSRLFQTTSAGTNWYVPHSKAIAVARVFPRVVGGIKFGFRKSSDSTYNDAVRWTIDDSDIGQPFLLTAIFQPVRGETDYFLNFAWVSGTPEIDVDYIDVYVIDEYGR